MRKASWGLGLAMILTATMAHAQAHGQSTYGSAGCGLGSMIFGDQKGLIQVLASTTNYTVWSQTFGITSGTSNCGEAGFSTQATRIFIEGNREALAKDAARGNGETITTLSAMAGCKDAKAVGSALQKRFAQIFPGEKTPVEQVSQNVIQELRGDNSLACKNIG